MCFYWDILVFLAEIDEKSFHLGGLNDRDGETERYNVISQGKRVREAYRRAATQGTMAEAVENGRLSYRVRM